MQGMFTGQKKLHPFDDPFQYVSPPEADKHFEVGVQSIYWVSEGILNPLLPRFSHEPERLRNKAFQAEDVVIYFEGRITQTPKESCRRHCVAQACLW